MAESPEPGPRDPIGDLGHFVSNRIGGMILDLEEGESPDWERARQDFETLFGGYADGTFQYQQTDGFNPEIAAQLREEVSVVLHEGITLEEAQGYLSKLFGIADQYAIDTGQPDRTRQAVRDMAERLRSERSR